MEGESNEGGGEVKEELKDHDEPRETTPGPHLNLPRLNLETFIICAIILGGDPRWPAASSLPLPKATRDPVAPIPFCSIRPTSLQQTNPPPRP